MHRYYKVLTTLTVLVLTLVATTSVVAASPADDYYEAMQSFLPVIIEWNEEVQSTAHAAAIKGEPDTIERLNELGVQGEYILDDLRGTAVSVPGPLRPAHWMLADAVGSLTVAAQAADEDPMAAALTIDEQLEWVSPAISKLENYLTRFGIIRGGDTLDPVESTK